METAPSAVDPAAEARRRPRAERLHSGAAASDALATYYSAVADDGGQAAARREAALLFALAEEFLRDGGSGDHEGALRAAEDAHRSARAGGDLGLRTDAARLVVKAHCLRALNLRYERGSEGAAAAREALGAARSFAEQELCELRREGCARGEAAMQLSVAEVWLEERGAEERGAALGPAEESRRALQGCGDKKLEATALLTMSAANASQRERRRAHEAAEQALSLFRDIGDRSGEARALHALSVACFMETSFLACDQSLRHAQEAMAIYEELGSRGLLATELVTVADLYLNLDRPKQAVAASKEALHLYRQTGYGRGSEATALGMLVQAHTELDQLSQALQVAKDGAARFQSSGDLRQGVAALDIVAHAHLEKGEHEEAAVVAKAALELCQELEDHCVEARLLLTLSEARERLDQLDESLQAAQDAAAIFRALDGEWELAGYAQYFVARLHAQMLDIEQALEEAQLARDLFYKVNNVRCEGLTILQIAGITGMDRNRLAEAIGLAEQAREVFQKAEDRVADAYALHVKADMYRLSGDFDAAIQAAAERRKVLQELGYRKEEAKSLHAIASIYLAKGDTTEAARAAREGLRLARACSDRATEVHMLIQLAHAAALLVSDGGGHEKQPRHAEEMLKSSKEAVAIARKIAGGRLRAPALFWNAYALNATPQAMEALDVVEEASRLFRAARDRLGEAHASLLTAQVYFVRDKADRAKELAEASLQMFQELGDRQGQELVQATLQQFAANAGRQQQQQQPKLEEARPEQEEERPAVPAASMAVAKPQGLDPVEVRKTVHKIALDTIGDEDDIDADSPLMDMGLDSLSSVSLRNDLAKEFRVTLAAAVMFDYPSVAALTDHIIEKSAL